MHPLSVKELYIRAQSDLSKLLLLGGFPEPYFSGSERTAKRWSRTYRQRLIREDLEVNHATAKKWLEIFSQLYHVFTVPPFGSPKIKSVKKEFKHYHFDWSLIADRGNQFENFIGSHLLKWCHWIEDTEGIDMELRYFRDKEQREVDFVILQQNKPILFCEVKASERTFSPHLFYLKQKFPNVRAVQVTLDPIDPVLSPTGLELISALDFLQELPV